MLVTFWTRRMTLGGGGDFDAKECHDHLMNFLSMLRLISFLICRLCCARSRRVVYIFSVKTHLHKALIFYVQYAFILYSI